MLSSVGGMGLKEFMDSFKQLHTTAVEDMKLCGFTSTAEMLPRLRVARVEGDEVLREDDEGLTLQLERRGRQQERPKMMEK